MQHAAGVGDHAIEAVPRAIDLQPLRAVFRLAIQPVAQRSQRRVEPAGVAPCRRVNEAGRAVLPERSAAVHRQTRRQIDQHRDVVVRLVVVYTGHLLLLAAREGLVEDAVALIGIVIPARDLHAENVLEAPFDSGRMVYLRRHVAGDAFDRLELHRKPGAAHILGIVVELVAYQQKAMQAVRFHAALPAIRWAHATLNEVYRGSRSPRPRTPWPAYSFNCPISGAAGFFMPTMWYPAST